MSERDRKSDVLAEAIRFETEGREFFLKAAERTKDYFGKMMFESIAEDELGHIKRIKGIHDDGLASGTWESPPLPLGEKRLETIFQRAKGQIAEQVNVDADEMEAVRLAIQLERKGHQFYSRLADEAGEEAEKRFYIQLAEEETRHLSILQEMEGVLMRSSGLE